MKNTTALLMALGLALPAMTYGQDANPSGPRPEGPPPRFDRPRPQQPPPLIGALDANHDGVIDEDEIKNAAEALRKLDRNGDGKLTMDELRPPRPEGAREGDGPRFTPRGDRPEGPADGPRPRRGPRSPDSP